jgi:hypothetical protein
MLTRQEMKQIWNRSKKNVHVSCDENHAHSADCLSPTSDGTQADVDVCRLHDTLEIVLDKVEKLTKELPR